MKFSAAGLERYLPSPVAANPWVLLAIAPFTLFFGSTAYLNSTDKEPFFVFAILVLAHLAESLVVLSAKPIIYAVMRQPNGWRIILLYTLGGLANSLVLIFLLSLQWRTPGSGLSAWVVISIGSIIHSAWLLLGHLPMGLLTQNYKQLSQIQQTNIELDRLASNANLELQAYTNSLQVAINDRVRDVLGKISEQLSALAPASNRELVLETAKFVQDITNNDVRKISHELSMSNDFHRSPSSSGSRAKFRAFSRIAGDSSANIDWVMTVGTLMAVSLALAIGNLLTLAVVLIALALGFPILAAVDRWRTKASNRWPIWLRVVSAPIEYILLALVGVETVKLLTAGVPEVKNSWDAFSTAVPVAAVTIWFLVFLIRGYTRTLDDRTVELGKASLDLERDINLVNLKLKEVRSRLAKLLHGSVQGRLASVSLALTSVAKEKDLNTAEILIQKARQQLDLVQLDLAEAFENPKENLSFAEAVETLIDNWAGLLQVDLKAEPAVSQVLQVESELTNKVYHAMQEAVTNAVRHSEAKRIVFNFELENSILVMQASNDVANITKEFTAGLGWLSMQSEAATLQFEQSEDEFVLRVSWKL